MPATIGSAEEGDYSVARQLLLLLQHPFDEPRIVLLPTMLADPESKDAAAAERLLRLVGGEGEQLPSDDARLICVTCSS